MCRCSAHQVTQGAGIGPRYGRQAPQESIDPYCPNCAGRGVAPAGQALVSLGTLGTTGSWCGDWPLLTYAQKLQRAYNGLVAAGAPASSALAAQAVASIDAQCSSSSVYVQPFYGAYPFGWSFPIGWWGARPWYGGLIGAHSFPFGGGGPRGGGGRHGGGGGRR